MAPVAEGTRSMYRPSLAFALIGSGLPCLIGRASSGRPAVFSAPAAPAATTAQRVTVTCALFGASRERVQASATVVSTPNDPNSYDSVTGLAAVGRTILTDIVS